MNSWTAEEFVNNLCARCSEVISNRYADLDRPEEWFGARELMVATLVYPRDNSS